MASIGSDSPTQPTSGRDMDDTDRGDSGGRGSRAYRLEVPGVRGLFELVRRDCDQVFGPRLKDGAIVLERLGSFEELPVGCHDRQAAGSYAVEQSGDATLFHYAVGPQAVKKLLHPAARRLFTAQRSDGDWQVRAEEPGDGTVALFGIRSCDVESIDVLDQVFLGGDVVEPHYRAARRSLLLITASCPQPSGVCFCTSMGHGPKPRRFDINLTEIWSEREHYFVAESGTDRGRELLQSLVDAAATGTDAAVRLADSADLEAAGRCVENACDRIEKRIDTGHLAEDIADHLDSVHWAAVGERCLACGNCTMVCPTCFCTTTFDVTDLAQDTSEHWQRWDSCFNPEFSLIHGGAIRQSVDSRYRQWLSHKLSTWFDQFGRSGCVGCGRCIAWCPVGIDIVEEAGKLRG